MADAAARFAELSAAAAELTDRGLTAAAKWATEMLCGLPPGAAAGAAELLAVDAAARAADPDPPTLLLARACFSDREYARAAHLLAHLAPGPHSGALGGKAAAAGAPAKALFLRAYSLYLAGEQRREADRVQKSGLLGAAQSANPQLGAVEALLDCRTAEVDPFCLYLRGLVAVDRGRDDDARRLLSASASAYPCNWAAWQALLALCPDLDTLGALPLPAHWARDAFLAAACLELQHNAEALSRLQVVNQLFPGSDWVTAAAAAAHYSMRNFEEAQRLYEDLLARDPHRIEGMDAYSNILYVKEAFAALSHLAHRVAASDRYRPESCCIIGNYYSLKARAGAICCPFGGFAGQHERAVEYFRRALRLSRRYQSAWTLMGHEYVELKNAPAAIDAYRQAIEVSPRDYRAWYGLGQTYELLGMPYYALHYYRRGID
ncbi:anaphase-promoting complex subunit 8 [Raphidocelis subcapitata]|uniref:Anaphase-promoting complex subunit 8 n=1 Tax=Raphidocelis subcapitata TaxID=307507 RepID=A0A2V0NXL0_9CHLO|nr:anaphase-promoting complex subunit 8 [Raphidocelis subcapitata]|eukprot:GBF90303.1 anaphase-promoting complex subunit 8 [Raphidocelis subcapitata]